VALDDTPTAEPSAEPTASPSAGPTASPNAKYVSFSATLVLNNATSNVLDATATSILEGSVATAISLPASAVTLLSYEATLSAHAIHCQHVGENDAHGTSAWSLSSYLRHPPEHDESKSVAACSRRLAAGNHYDITTHMGIKAALSDFPQFGSNSAAVYLYLVTTLLAAVQDNTLKQLIVTNSINAGSATFAYINEVNVTSISPLDGPSPDPSRPSGASSQPGEIAGAIIGAMIGIGLFLALAYYGCMRCRRVKKADGYVVYEPYNAPTETGSTQPPAVVASAPAAGRTTVQTPSVSANKELDRRSVHSALQGTEQAEFEALLL
jgi:hypothetical protein